ncbi:MAG: glutaredoxin family protein [Minisyncoccia bacterium]
MKPVAIYTTPTCHFCNLAKEFFAEHKIKYSTYDVSIDMAKRTEMVAKSGQMGVPVITIGNDLVVGFNEPRIRALLGIAD